MATETQIMKVGELLVVQKAITRGQLDEAQRLRKEKGWSLDACLIHLGHIKGDQWAELMSKRTGHPVVSKELLDDIPPEVIGLVKEDLVRKHTFLPIRRDGDTLHVVVADPFDQGIHDDVRFATSYTVKILIAPPDLLREKIAEYYGGAARPSTAELRPLSVAEENGKFGGRETADLEKASTSDEPAVKFVHFVLSSAVKSGASDIHIETSAKEVVVRFRIDGDLREVGRQKTSQGPNVIARIKIIFSLDIAEKRLPQGGRARYKLGEKTVDFRASIMPSVQGEEAVLRILDSTAMLKNLDGLGFEPGQLADFRHALQNPYGMILVTGPTGSGKSTTLYSALSELNKPDVKVCTVEDPVEIEMPGLTQIMVNEAIKLTFAEVLRSFLRHDPDVIMVGEIRDLDTANIAIKAALTGHLVLSTLHTNDAASTVSRLVDMGVDPSLIADALRLVVAQRLVKRICPQCQEDTTVPVETLVTLGMDRTSSAAMVFSKGKGCKHCYGSGYRGRLAVHEILVVDDKIRRIIREGSPSNEIRGQINPTLRQSALLKLQQRMTTMEEVVQNTLIE